MAEVATTNTNRDNESAKERADTGTDNTSSNTCSQFIKSQLPSCVFVTIWVYFALCLVSFSVAIVAGTQIQSAWKPYAEDAELVRLQCNGVYSPQFTFLKWREGKQVPLMEFGSTLVWHGAGCIGMVCGTFLLFWASKLCQILSYRKKGEPVWRKEWWIYVWVTLAIYLVVAWILCCWLMGFWDKYLRVNRYVRQYCDPSQAIYVENEEISAWLVPFITFDIVSFTWIGVTGISAIAYGVIVDSK